MLFRCSTKLLWSLSKNLHRPESVSVICSSKMLGCTWVQYVACSTQQHQGEAAQSSKVTTTAIQCKSSMTDVNKLHMRSTINIEVEQSNESDLSNTFAYKAKTGGYGLLWLAGLGMSAVCLGTIGIELFSSNRVTVLYGKAVEECRAHQTVQDLLGKPIKAFGEYNGGRGGRNHIMDVEYTDSEGRKGMRIQFYLQGSRNRGTVLLDVR